MVEATIMPAVEVLAEVLGVYPLHLLGDLPGQPLLMPYMEGRGVLLLMAAQPVEVVAVKAEMGLTVSQPLAELVAQVHLPQSPVAQ